MKSFTKMFIKGIEKSIIEKYGVEKVVAAKMANCHPVISLCEEMPEYMDHEGLNNGIVEYTIKYFYNQNPDVEKNCCFNKSEE